MRRRCDSDKCAFSTDKLQSILPSILFYLLSSPRSAGTIFLPFYRHRAAREQYFCLFIVAVQRGNDIFPFYRRRAAFLQMHLLRL